MDNCERTGVSCRRRVRWGFDTWAHRDEKGKGWLVAGKFSIVLKFKTVIKAKTPYRKPDSTLVLKNPNKKIREMKKTRVYS
jgi:hypothetical protein